MKRIEILDEAARDIEAGIAFYNSIEQGAGDYFRDSIISDLRGLQLYFGQHRIHHNYHRTFSNKFPYAIYYRDRDNLRQVIAILDMRRSPHWISNQIKDR